METKIDIKRALRVFNIITQRDSKTTEGWHFDGIRAHTDHDGYTVTLAGEQAQLTILFHNSHRFDFANNRAARNFIKRIDTIDSAAR
jgi:hypothetical protein